MKTRLLAVAVISTASVLNAACYDGDVISFHPEHVFVDLCTANQCEPASITRSCGNIHYSAIGLQTENHEWLFRVRFHQEGDADDESMIERDGEPSTTEAVRRLTCRGLDTRCAFINDVISGVMSNP